jgi:hypothetical protein
MTVIGPISQLVWDKSVSSSLHNTLFWTGDKVGTNAEFVEFNRKFMELNKWKNVNQFMLENSNQMLLNMLPDFSFQMWNPHMATSFPSEETVASWNVGERVLRNQFGPKWYSNALMKREKTDTPVIAGQPTLGLMAVIFTFKKPTGHLEVFELTNLGSWPPVVFFLPVIVPAGTMLGDDRYLPCKDHARIVQQQPTMMTYRLALDVEHRIKAFGQPFNLISVDKEGKTADTLRSLSDVFRALWSEATQYSAWNSTLSFDPKERAGSSKWPVSMALEPMGAGRRIRGHNRYAGMYPMDNVQLLWETAIDSEESEVFQWVTPNISKREYLRQLRSTYSGKREAIYVLPSYFTTKTAKNLQPLALTLLRFMFAPTAGLGSFLDGSLVNNAAPTRSDTAGDVAPRISASFLDRMLKTCGVKQDEKNLGALPLHRVEGEIAFDPEGDPTVFGLRSKREETFLLSKPIGELTEEGEFEQIRDNVDVLGNFSFLDAFCSKSTRDLTDVFGEVKEKSISGEVGTKARDMLEDTLAVDLFDGDAGDLLFSVRDALKKWS